MKRYLATITLCLALTACAGRGPRLVYTEGGVANPQSNADQYPNTNLVSNFQSAAKAAQNNMDSRSYTAFMRSGFALIYARCNSYFDEKGSQQANANLVRGSIAPIAAVVSGIFALHDYGNADNAEHDIALLTLGTTTSIAALDVFSQHFLFGADNVESVRELIKEELNSHSGEALKLQPSNIEEAAIQIIDNQNICTPAHILKSTRAAIANGKVDAFVSGEGSTEVTDSTRQQIGKVLGLNPPTVTESQAGMLFAVTMGYVRRPAEMKFAYAKLVSLSGKANPIVETTNDAGEKTYAINGEFDFAGVKAVFASLPAATRAVLEARAKVVVEAGAGKVQEDAQSVAKAGGMKTFLAANGNPEQKLQEFVRTSDSEVTANSSSQSSLRRVTTEVN